MPPDSAADTARGWIELAARDLRVIDSLDADEHGEMVLFHAQQVVEETLKAVLIAQGVVPPFVHSIERLVAALPDLAVPLPEGVTSCSDVLFEAYVESRYDPFGDAPSDDDVRAGVQAARDADRWARELVG